MAERDFDKEILMLLNRLRILKEKIIELINICNTTIEHSALSQFDDFEASTYIFQEIALNVDDSYNLNSDYATEILINASKLFKGVRKQDIIKNSTTFGLVSILQACKDFIDKMIGVLTIRENWLLGKLEHCKIKNEELKEKINILTKKNIEGNSSEEIANNIVESIFPIGTISGKKRKSLIKIIKYFLENKNKESTYEKIINETKLARNTVRTNCDDLKDKEVLRINKVNKTKFWYLSSKFI